MKHMGIIRVFVRRTSFTPIDDYVFIGMPPGEEFIPEHREVHVSCTFTWDKEAAKYLQFQWEGRTKAPVKLGGPAFGSPVERFTQGLYIKPNIIFTTRGCNNNCSYCCVPKVEGRLRELDICQGNIIQDNNFLQASRRHKDKVFEMLKTQRQICFKGGLECDLVDDHFVEAVRGLRISELWLACDSDSDIPAFRRAAEKLTKAGFNRNKIYCYVLVGKNLNRDRDEARCRKVYEAGAMPRAQLYRDFSDTKTKYSDDWEKWARMWQRPAATIRHMREGTDHHEFGT